MRAPPILGRFLIWKVKNIEHRYFLFLISIIIGSLAGLAAVTLKTTVHYIEVFFTQSKVFDPGFRGLGQLGYSRAAISHNYRARGRLLVALRLWDWYE